MLITNKLLDRDLIVINRNRYLLGLLYTVTECTIKNVCINIQKSKALYQKNSLKFY